MNQPFDPFRVMETTDCDYPRLHGLDGREIAALHEWKCRTIASGYGLYKDTSMRRAAPIIAAYLKELAQNIERAEAEYPAAQEPTKRPLDPLRIMETTNCEYPRLHGLDGREIAALHEWKSRTIAYGYGLYKDISMRRAAPIVAAYLKKLARNIERAAAEHSAAQERVRVAA